MFEKYKSAKELKKNEKLLDDEKFSIDANGNGIIDVGAEDYNDIFSYYSLNGYNVLDSEFDVFLEAKAEAIPLERELTIQCHIHDATDEKQAEIQKAIKDHYERQIHEINRELTTNILSCIYLGIAGAICFVIFCLLQYFEMHFAIQAITEIISWVFIWEVVHLLFIERRKIKLRRVKKYRISRAKIIVSEYQKKKVKITKKSF